MQQKPISDDHLGQVDESWYLGACLHGGGGPQVGEVTHFGG